MIADPPSQVSSVFNSANFGGNSIGGLTMEKALSTFQTLSGTSTISGVEVLSGSISAAGQTITAGALAMIANLGSDAQQQLNTLTTAAAAAQSTANAALPSSNPAFSGTLSGPSVSCTAGITCTSLAVNAGNGIAVTFPAVSGVSSVSQVELSYLHNCSGQIESRITSINGTLSGHTSTIASHTSSLSSQNSSIVSNAADIVTANSAIAATNSAVSSLSSTVATNTSNITANTSAIALCAPISNTSFTGTTTVPGLVVSGNLTANSTTVTPTQLAACTTISSKANSATPTLTGPVTINTGSAYALSLVTTGTGQPSGGINITGNADSNSNIPNISVRVMTKSANYNIGVGYVTNVIACSGTGWTLSLGNAIIGQMTTVVNIGSGSITVNGGTGSINWIQGGALTTTSFTLAAYSSFRLVGLDTGNPVAPIWCVY